MSCSSNLTFSAKFDWLAHYFSSIHPYSYWLILVCIYLPFFCMPYRYLFFFLPDSRMYQILLKKLVSEYLQGYCKTSANLVCIVLLPEMNLFIGHMLLGSPLCLLITEGRNVSNSLYLFPFTLCFSFSLILA